MPRSVHAQTTVDLGVHADQIVTLTGTLTRRAGTAGKDFRVEGDANPMGAGLYYSHYVVHRRLSVVRGAGALKAAFDDAEILFLLTYQVLPATPAARSAAAVAAKATSITFRLGSSLSDFRVGEFKESLGAALDVEDSRFSLVAASPADDSPDNETTIRLKVMPAPPSAQKPSGGGPALSPVAIGQKLVGMHKNGTLALGNYEVEAVSFSQPKPPKPPPKKQQKKGAAILLAGNRTTVGANGTSAANATRGKNSTAAPRPMNGNATKE